jgi:hypothetical protein
MTFERVRINRQVWTAKCLTCDAEAPRELDPSAWSLEHVNETSHVVEEKIVNSYATWAH